MRILKYPLDFFKCNAKPSLRNSKGSALVAVLATLALIASLVAEFVYSIYISTNSFDYWLKAQQLSLAARSGIVLAAKAMTEAKDIYSLSPTGYIIMPIEKVTDSFQGDLIIRAYDENSRFNLNSMVFQNGQINPEAYEAFKRLLRALNIEEKTADYIVDWIDRDREERIGEGENEAKNNPLDALDEIYQIKGLSRDNIVKLWEYVTVYGYDRVDSPVVNINSAPVPVIMSLDERITLDMAERIIQYRSLEPLKNTADLTKVSGFEGTLGQSLIGRVAVRVRKIRILSEAQIDRVRRTIECVVELQGSSQIVKYWSER